jgi:UDP-N-acetylmuramoylalanine--D-glutamate ligase
MFERDKYKRICVLGYGRSGIACARLLLDKGYEVFISEHSTIDENLFPETDIAFEHGGHTDKVLSYDCIVKSPGIKPNIPILKSAREKNIPVFSEIEVALSFLPQCTLIAITGTNGKTTITELVGKTMSEQYPGKVRVCGNISIPIASIVSNVRENDFLVMEVSSYQLEDSSFFKPNFALISNITPDHIDHHGNFETYLNAKAKIFRFLKAEDFCIFNFEDENCMKLAKKCNSKKMFFSSKRQDDNLSSYLSNGKICFQTNGSKHLVSPPNLPGVHNLENAMSAGLLALLAGVKTENIEKAFSKFKGVEHRIETVSVQKDITFINDSKATNVESTLTALKALNTNTKHIYLILGGEDKGSPYSPLLPWINKNIKEILTVGQASQKIETELGEYAKIIPCENIENAVKYAFENAQAGDVVLLSPACASFDQFKNFEERGKHFKDVVLSLAQISSLDK